MASSPPEGSPAAGSRIDSRLSERLAELSDLAAATALLGWDRETHMPPQGAGPRGEVLATLERLHHERLADPALGGLLAAAGRAAAGEPESDVAAIARVVGRDHERATRIPPELTGRIVRATAEALPVWQRARAESDFAAFAPHLERAVELRREVAACFPDAEHPYDALLDAFEPGMTTARARAVLAELRAGLVPLVAAIAERPEPAGLHGPFAVDAQRAAALEIARSFGYDDRAWRLDDAVHPFASAIARTDVRVTGRWDEGDLSGLFAVMHEVGHGLYEAGVAPGLDRTTLGTGVSLGIHESQSRLWENQVGRSRVFWSHWQPRLAGRFSELGEIGLDDLVRAVNVVRPSLIRVDADEVTYGLHVVLRFELEVALVEGALAARDVPGAWNELMRELLGVAVPDDARGCLQDIHWAFGELGYFPTYALGNIAAAQLWDAARRDLPALDDSLAAGDGAPLLGWLRERVHSHGRRLDPAELLMRATGSELDPAPLIRYLTAKYAELYAL